MRGFLIEVSEPPLFAAVELARATKGKVVFGKLKAIFGGGECFESCECSRAFAIGIDKAVRLVIASDDATAELMKLCKPKTPSAFDQNDGGVWHIDADFHHRCGDENIYLVSLELLHHLLFLPLLSLILQ
jgi:hypothetical protein